MTFRAPIARSLAVLALLAALAPAAEDDVTVYGDALAAGWRPGSIAFAPLSANAAGQDFTAVLLGDCTGNWAP